MRRQLASALEEVRLQLEIDEERGSAPLAVRARALRDARAACDPPAERQALIDLAAACVACAAQLPAPQRVPREWMVYAASATGAGPVVSMARM